MLDSHPQVTAYGELMLSPDKDMMLPRDVEYFSDYLVRRARGRPVARHLLALRFLGQVFSSSDATAVGFKLMYDDFYAYPELLAYLAARRVRVIHVVRENLLDIVISRQAALAQGVYHVWGDKPVGPVRVTLDTAHLLGQLRALALQQRVARRLLPLSGIRVRQVGYEELVQAPQGFARLLEFLGVDGSAPLQLQSTLRKVVRESHTGVIVNYEAVAGVLGGTRFECMLRAR